jgi:hypothetical protein
MKTNKKIIEINEITYDFLKNLKDKMGKSNDSWDDWLINSFELDKPSSDEKTIENIFKKSTYDKYYDSWIKNFSINLPNIWNEHSANFLKSTFDKTSSALVIGRGPSIAKNNHFELLAKSNYSGCIMCSDGSLSKVLDAGITPDKFPNFFVITIDSQDRQQACYDHDIVKKYGDKIKCILSTTVSPLTYSEVKNAGMEIYWLNTLFDYDNGKNSFNYISNAMIKTKNHSKGLPAIQTGGNVGTSAWVVCWTILQKSVVGFIGIDHGYSSNERTSDDHLFPEGIDKNTSVFKRAYPIIYNPDFDCYCQQDPIFQYYSNAFKEFIDRTSSSVKTINATEGGAIFGKGIECMKLEEFLEKFK